jgi:TolA-binding protein
MRPQLGMVALLLLMIGSSLLVLRSHPSARDEARVKESGVPEIEGEGSPLGADTSLGEPATAVTGAVSSPAQEPHKTAAALDPMSPALPPGRGARTGHPKAKSHGMNEAPRDYEQAVSAYRSGDYAEAERRFSALARAGGSRAAEAAFEAAQATREGWGCAAAVPKLAEIASRYADSAIGHDAAWQAALCYRDLGQRDRAEGAFRSLLHAPGYEQRSAEALAALTEQAAAAANRASVAPVENASATAANLAAPTPGSSASPPSADEAAGKE